MASSEKVRVMQLGESVNDLDGENRIAKLDGNVYMLYLSGMTLNLVLLLYISYSLFQGSALDIQNYSQVLPHREPQKITPIEFSFLKSEVSENWTFTSATSAKSGNWLKWGCRRAQTIRNTVTSADDYFHSRLAF